ncbi:unnamed protein product [Didymodactylos carnosus]|uniref:Alpha-tubulin N-acetyltransferase n=1 Tax=Didymodactylos carnosus TaxID=1234261 RepID=A0A8S2HQ86_9BILA|nr:unnamed protein product [Didymodactylos carnosus]CAF3667686.1 unnamed protein product [Didymodactylos carnosus]
MEFPFDINAVLPYDVTILNGDYRILNHEQTIRNASLEKLSIIIDAMGEASYKAQGLPGSVTTARKFRISDHRLYIVKNSSDNRSMGSAVGILKVGHKHLYVYDLNGQVHERTPLCVLDFYVHESKQRCGYGKKLFDEMLQFEKCKVRDLAIDRPSSKCLGFLQKHFNLTAPIHQVNNFVVFHGFFDNKHPNEPHTTSSKRSQNLGYRTQTASTGQNLSNYTTYLPRSFTNNQIFNENDYFVVFLFLSPFPSLRRYNTNPVIPLTNTNNTSLISATFNDSSRSRKLTDILPVSREAKDYSNNNLSKPYKTQSAVPLTSMYTFPSLINNNWQRDASWRGFGGSTTTTPAVNLTRW